MQHSAYNLQVGVASRPAASDLEYHHHRRRGVCKLALFLDCFHPSRSNGGNGGDGGGGGGGDGTNHLLSSPTFHRGDNIKPAPILVVSCVCSDSSRGESSRFQSTQTALHIFYSATATTRAFETVISLGGSHGGGAKKWKS
ncbi:hypothetical protein EX30DRAFT_348902 [Ascodesmis nigricans]|uniref:Uncharacterized protein n=1 Tax=Ascodesmis nigricans TaxID=341454 RepID=A0A4S2MWI5_9PEZI|nr:hypothetical protein EX30DRAFT_348902 [Ascodesmis nigricans]